MNILVNWSVSQLYMKL